MLHRYAAEVSDTADAHCVGYKPICDYAEIWSGSLRGQLCSRAVNQLQKFCTIYVILQPS